MDKKDGGPAFPTEQGYDYKGERVVSVSPGMTLRDYFAGQALGIMNTALDQGYWSPRENPNAEIAAASYQIADAMLSERDK